MGSPRPEPLADPGSPHPPGGAQDGEQGDPGWYLRSLQASQAHVGSAGVAAGIG